jgi:ArsR family transcriptional regulator
VHTILTEQARIFKVFCVEKRLQILEMLRDGEKCACVLLEKLDLGQPGLSYHMKVLVESGVVQSRQVGKWTYYKISESGSAHALSLLKELTTPKTVGREEARCSNRHCDSQPMKR